MAPIHDRMPVVLSDADIDVWLNPEENNPLLLSSLLRSADEDALTLLDAEHSAAKQLNLRSNEE